MEGRSVLGDDLTLPCFVYKQNRDCYEVQACGREGGRIEVLWHARVLCGWEPGCEVLSEHGAGSGDHTDKQSRRNYTPILGAACMSIVGLLRICHTRRGKPPPRALRGLEADTVDGWPEGKKGVASAWGEGVVKVNPHM